MVYINISHLWGFIFNSSLKIFLFLFSIILIPFFLILFIILSPIYLLRKIISQLAPIFKHDLGKMLTTRSSIYSVMNVYSEKPLLNIVAVSVVDRKMEIETLRQLINSKLLLKENTIMEVDDKNRNQSGFINTKNLKYPELRQYIQKWMGFVFWKWDNNFKIENHIKLDPRKRFTSQMVDEMQSRCLMKPFDSNRSPWEVILIQNYVDKQNDEGDGVIGNNQKSIIFWRLHHTLTDGLSLLKLLLTVTGSEAELKKVKQTYEKNSSRSFKQCVVNYLRRLRIPYDAVYNFFDSLSFKPWGVSPLKYLNEYISITSDKIPTHVIKTIEAGYDVGFTSVLLSALTSAIRKGHEIRQLNIPDSMYVMMPFPAPGHPDKLRNYSTLGLINLPVGELDATKRIKKCNKSFLRAKKSSMPLVFFYGWQMIGGLFHWMIKILLRTFMGGVFVTSFPGPKTIQKFGGHDALDFSFLISFQPGSIGVGFAIMSYVDGLKITAIVDKAIFPEESQVKKLVDAIMAEINILITNLL